MECSQCLVLCIYYKVIIHTMQIMYYKLINTVGAHFVKSEHTYTHTHTHIHFPKPPEPMGRNRVTLTTVTEISDLELPLRIQNSQPSEGISRKLWSPLACLLSDSSLVLVPVLPCFMRSQQHDNSENRGKPNAGGWTPGPATPQPQ